MPSPHPARPRTLLPRRRFLTRALACGALFGSPTALRTLLPRPAAAQEAASEEGIALLAEAGLLQRVRGEADAPNTLVEYASFTCPHCAAFHENIYPTLLSEWIETGRMRLVYRHFPLDRTAVRAALLAECLESDAAYFTFLDLLYRTQTDWARAADPEAELVSRAALAGLSEERARACMSDEDVVARMSGEYERAIRELNVRSTPSLFFNGVLLSNTSDVEAFTASLTSLALD